MLGKLAEEHVSERRLGKDVVRGLSEAVASGAPVRGTPALREKILAFARNECRHLAIENSIILPIARARLIAQDLATLARTMAERRGR